jgi:hypothetical protein
MIFSLITYINWHMNLLYMCVSTADIFIQIHTVYILTLQQCRNDLDMANFNTSESPLAFCLAWNIHLSDRIKAGRKLHKGTDLWLWCSSMDITTASEQSMMLGSNGFK